MRLSLSSRSAIRPPVSIGRPTPYPPSMSRTSASCRLEMAWICECHLYTARPPFCCVRVLIRHYGVHKCGVASSSIPANRPNERRGGLASQSSLIDGLPLGGARGKRAYWLRHFCQIWESNYITRTILEKCKYQCRGCGLKRFLRCGCFTGLIIMPFRRT